MSRVILVNEINGRIPVCFFDEIKNEILGKSYKLSIIFTSAVNIRRLNKIYRDLNITTDILSFPYSNNSGEIFICLSESRKEARKFDREFDNFISFIFIHGCVHLKGHDHGSTMEAIEKKYRSKFNI